MPKNFETPRSLPNEGSLRLDCLRMVFLIGVRWSVPWMFLRFRVGRLSYGYLRLRHKVIRFFERMYSRLSAVTAVGASLPFGRSGSGQNYLRKTTRQAHVRVEPCCSDRKLGRMAQHDTYAEKENVDEERQYGCSRKAHSDGFFGLPDQATTARDRAGRSSVT